MLHTLTIKLKQHTPLLHFQHDQEGATLRASEVKPRFDAFLKAQGLEVPSYKMRIVPDSSPVVSPTEENYIKKDGSRGSKSVAPMFFGSGKKLVNCPSLTMTLTVLTGDLEVLKDNIEEFFFQNNFGTRQSKGYGSFTVDSFNTVPHNYVSFFSITGDCLSVFKRTELIYKTLRGGINGRDNNSFYFKSLMFSYAALYNCHWDKRNIKQHFLQRDLDSQIKQYRGQEPLSYNPLTRSQFQQQFPGEDCYAPEDNKLYDFRDLLGFSTVENWRAYNMTLRKKYDDGGLARFKSPILFKPVCVNNNEWRVYVMAENPPFDALGKKVTVSTNNGSMEMSLFPDFNIMEYLHFAFLEEDISSHISNGDGRNASQKEQILKTYRQLKENYNLKYQ